MLSYKSHLIQAVQHALLEVIRLLLQNKADVHFAHEITLNVAIERADMSIIELLIEASLDGDYKYILG